MGADPRTPTCATIESWLGEARPLSPTEQASVDRHLASCPACRRLEDLLGLMDHARHGVPGPALDEVRRRRLLSGAVDRAATLAASAAPARRSRPGRWRWIAAAGLAAGLAALAIGLTVVRRAGLRWASPRGPVVALATETAPAGELRLLAGEVRVDGRPVMLPVPLPAGARLETGAGEAVLRTAAGVLCLLEPRTRLSLRTGRSDRTELALQEGTVAVAVSPDRPVDGEVKVTTPHGTITVVGTVFSVSATAERSRVAVARGVVRVDAGGRVELVRQGQGMALGDPAPLPSAPEEAAVVTARQERLRVLQRARTALLAVDSLPHGAEVTHGGVLLGSTPLVTYIPAEPATLTVALDGHQSVTELVAPGPDRLLRRDFRLLRVPEPGPTPAASTPADRGSEGRGTRRVPNPPAPRPDLPPATPEAWTQQARARMLAGDWPAAAQAYRELIRRHPGAASTDVARVSLGTLELDRLGQPAAALRSFEAYLAARPRGPLAEEAAHGRAQALRALGRTCDEIRALRAFLRDHPAALHHRRAARRLADAERSAKAACPRP